ncbi:MAG: 5'-3' exonuclease H3TH domain-containing protein [Gemmatimonadales bacterium]
MNIHLIDGTYELFRHYFAVPKVENAQGLEVGALRGVVHSLLGMLEDGATHMAVATDHVVESFRNDMWEGYKDGSGIEPELLAQFHPFEDALRAVGIVVWPMVEYEADDALAAGAAMALADTRVERVLICTPDKDLAQCVVADRVVQFDRRKRLVIDRAGVVEKFGVEPESIPDYLALVGDSADGFPGLPGWGAKSAGVVLGRYGYLEEIPAAVEDWDVTVRGAARLAATLRDHMDDALLFRRLATLDVKAPVSASVDELKWSGPAEGWRAVLEGLGLDSIVSRVERRLNIES